MWGSPEAFEAAQALQAEETERIKKEEEELELKVKRTPDQQRTEARNNIEQAGIRMASRVIGMIEREASRLLDQFEILYKEKTQLEVKKVIWKKFIVEVDNAAEELRNIRPKKAKLVKEK